MNVETVIAEYQSSLRAFLLSRMKNPADVDDVLQDTLIKTFRNFHTLKSDQKIKPWLFQIANNAMMDHFRRARRDASVVTEYLWYADPDDNSEHAFERCVEPFLDALPDDASDLLRAIELQGMSQKEYATKTGISYSTLKSRVQAGRRQLRSLFDQCCDVAFATDGSILDYNKKPKGCDKC